MEIINQLSMMKIKIFFLYFNIEFNTILKSYNYIIFWLMLIEFKNINSDLNISKINIIINNINNFIILNYEF